MPKRKLTLESGKKENKTYIRCHQHQCSFYRQGGCQPCSVCNADPFILKKDCTTCFNCANIEGELRWKKDTDEQDESMTLTEEEKLALTVLAKGMERRLAQKNKKKEEPIILEH